MLIQARFDTRHSRRARHAYFQLESLYTDLDMQGGGAAAARSDDGPQIGVTISAQAATAGIASTVAPPAAAAARLCLFWGAPLAPRWTVGGEIARTRAALGLLGEAERLFIDLRLWEEAVHALMLTGKKSRAIEIVRAQLDPAATSTTTTASTASLWCYLGDLTGDGSHYETAWSVSAGTCARAKLALGAAAIRAERWADARSELRDALGVKPHYAEAW